MDILGHASYLIYLASYLVRDMLRLRILTVVAGMMLVPYYAVQQEILWVPIIWVSLFNVVNVYQIVILIMERRPVGLTREEKALYKLTFAPMPMGLYKKLLKLSGWKDAAADEVLVPAGAIPGDLMIFSSGQLEAHIEGLGAVTMKAGQFIGELAFVTGEATTAKVIATSKVRYYSWPTANLHNEVDLGTELGTSIQATLGIDIAAKLRERNLKLRL